MRNLAVEICYFGLLFFLGGVVDTEASKNSFHSLPAFFKHGYSRISSSPTVSTDSSNAILSTLVEIRGGSAEDFGSFLAQSYSVPDNREEGPAVLGGTLGDALAVARSQARLLVALIPSSKPTRKGKQSKDQIAIESLLSSEVAAAANKKSRKSSSDELGSFSIWGAKAGSSEAKAAIKRLKVKTTSAKGDKRPVLVVIYPAQVIGSNGIPKLVPKVVAQHHCGPPPSPSKMAEWLNSLRKRHAKQYTAMQTELKEVEYFKERKSGYKESVKSDIERKERAKVEEAARLAKEKEEQERLEAIEKRREELKAALPEEDTSPEAKRIALRFADGRSGQRRFSPDESISAIFNWVDAMFEIEREKVILTTMNGKRTFEWDEESNDDTLDEAGLGKMTGFRVSEKVVEDEKPEEGEEDDDDDDEED